MKENNKLKQMDRLDYMDDGDYFVHNIPPYYSQFASRDLVSNCLDKQVYSKIDSRWKLFGYKTIEEYDFWAPRLCALICLKMVLDLYSNKSKSESISFLTEKAVSLGGYKVYDEQGTLIDKGWYYSPLIELAKQYGLNGEVCKELSIEELCLNVINNKYSIPSVNPKVIRRDIDTCEKKGGHLVVVLGFKVKNNYCQGFYIHNPSGRTMETQENAFVEINRFIESFAERGFSIWK